MAQDDNFRCHTEEKMTRKLNDRAASGYEERARCGWRRRNEEIASHQMHKKNCFTVENAGIACLWQ